MCDLLVILGVVTALTMLIKSLVARYMQSKRRISILNRIKGL